MTTSGARGAPAGLELPQVATSNDGYEFSPASDKWQLSKDIKFSLSFLRNVTQETNLGFRLTLTRYAEEESASHAVNMREEFWWYVRDTGARAVTVDALINRRSELDADNEWKLGALKGFLLKWHGWEFPGVSDEVVSLLQGWRIRGNPKGGPVAQGGALTDIELGAILDWANRASSRREIDLQAYTYILMLIMTARRAVQIAALRGVDLVEKHDRNGTPEYVIRCPRAKQRGQGFRQAFRQLRVIEDLYLVLRAQHRASVARVEKVLGCDVPVDLEQQVPIFINSIVLDEIGDEAELRDFLTGPAPDRLHAKNQSLESILKHCNKTCTAKSERTGESTHMTASRFRYTRATNLRRQGFGPEFIGFELDHSDTQQVRVYTENTVHEAEEINRLVGHQLAPFAQACMGTLVDSERDAIRGDDPRSRVPNHRQEAVGTCGNYGFCASGFRACYTCHHFQPWVDGPHKDVLTELYEEKKRVDEAGCAREVVNANDRLILAVEHCVALCDEAKASRGEVAQPIEVAPQELSHD